MSDRFEQLLKTLNQSELEMTGYELADLCWLLLHYPQIVEPSESKKSVDDTSSSSNTPSPLSKFKEQEQRNEKQTEKEKEPAGQLYPRQQSQDSFVSGGSSLNFPVDNPSDIGSSLSLARALKALLRRVPTQERPNILDEVQTVETSAATDQKFLTPIFKPALEPWLELALVVDRSSSMDIWHQTLVDIKTVLQHYGIFRDVQVWQLVLKENNLVLYKGLNKNNSRVSHPKELLNPNGRRIILVISDCVASYWQDGKMFPLLELWSQSSPLAILQMLPEWLWFKTALGFGAKVTLFSDEPGLTNSRLKIRDVLLWENVFHDKKRLQIPVFTLEPLSVERWSGVVVGRSDTKVAGFVLTPDTKEELETAAELNLTPEEIVRRFRNSASPLAQELAELLAAAPTIFLPVVRLLRKEMLPEAGQVQIAEVFLGGILRIRSSEIKETDPDLVLYDFINPEVRKILQCSSTRSTTVDVFDRVSKYIAKQLNLSLRDFLAELKKPPSEVDQEKQGIIRPFAEVAASILRNLGGNYLAIAQQLQQAVVEATQFPQLKTILLVEDNPREANQVRHILQREGKFTVLLSEDFEQIMNYARSGGVDLILLNYWLNHTYYQRRKMTGANIAETIRSDPSISSEIVLMGFSNNAERETEFRPYCNGFYSKQELLSSGNYQKFVDYLQKIFNQRDFDAFLRIGLSISRQEPSAPSGYIACFVRKRGRPDIFLLSVSHTLAPEDQDISIGDPVIIKEAREEANIIAILSEYNYSVDAAIARINSGRSIQATKLFESKILKGFLTLKQFKKKVSNLSYFSVFKQGKATGLTRGRITLFAVTIFLDLGNSKRTFEDMIAIEGEGEQPFALPGDSGSLVVDEDGYAIAVIIAGTLRGGNDRGLTYAMPIDLILKALDLELVLDDEIVHNELSHFVFEVITINASGQEFTRQTKYARYFAEHLSNGVPIDMVAIPGGTFMMGSPKGEGYSNEKSQHEVTVPPFFMGKYPVTQAQWKAIASLPKVKHDLNPSPSYFKGDDRPVERVSWHDAVEFCQRLSRKTGREYRLPSEPEWEYACRAGTTTPFHFGETITGKLANYDATRTYASEPLGEYRHQTTPVGSFPPNAFGLYDMHGNVWEWCADTWHDNYKGAPTDGSAWIHGGNDNRSPLRGGSWGSNPLYCRSAYRYGSIRERDDINNNIGFRVVCGVGRTLLYQSW